VCAQRTRDRSVFHAVSAVAGLGRSGEPARAVLAISIVVGLLMVIVFRYTSDQKAIGRTKERLKAHLLAVRLFSGPASRCDASLWPHPPSTGSYLRLAFLRFSWAILPITFLIIQLDRYFGFVPLRPAQTSSSKLESTRQPRTKSNCNCPRS